MFNVLSMLLLYRTEQFNRLLLRTSKCSTVVPFYRKSNLTYLFNQDNLMDPFNQNNFNQSLLSR